MGGRHLMDIIGDFSWTKVSSFGVNFRGHFLGEFSWTFWVNFRGHLIVMILSSNKLTQT